MHVPLEYGIIGHTYSEKEDDSFRNLRQDGMALHHFEEKERKTISVKIVIRGALQFAHNS